MPSCVHCNRDLHEEPLTQKVAGFYDSHTFDAEYSEDTDDTQIVCIGSYTEGPLPYRSYAKTSTTWSTGGPVGESSPQWLQKILVWPTPFGSEPIYGVLHVSNPSPGFSILSALNSDNGWYHAGNLDGEITYTYTLSGTANDDP